MAELKNDYNPYDYRETPFPISDFGALTNIVKAMLGTGILVAPMAFRNAGWLNGLFSTAIIGIVVLYSKEILMYGMYEIARRRRVPVFTYAEGVVEAIAEGPPCMRGLQGLMRGMVNALLVIYHFGSSCVYVVFIANCLKDLGDNYWMVWDSRFYMLCTTLPLCAIYCVRNMKSLVPFAMAANFALIIAFAMYLNDWGLPRLILVGTPLPSNSEESLDGSTISDSSDVWASHDKSTKNCARKGKTNTTLEQN